MARRWIAPIVLALVAGLAAGGWQLHSRWKAQQAEAAAADAVAKLQLEIADRLRDPESARFRNIHQVGDAVCGELNAKNGMGGYVGYRSFYYVDGVLNTDPDDGARSENLNRRVEELQAAIAFNNAYSVYCVRESPTAASAPASGV